MKLFKKIISAITLTAFVLASPVSVYAQTCDPQFWQSQKSYAQAKVVQAKADVVQTEPQPDSAQKVGGVDELLQISAKAGLLFSDRINWASLLAGTLGWDNPLVSADLGKLYTNPSVGKVFGIRFDQVDEAAGLDADTLAMNISDTSTAAIDKWLNDNFDGAFGQVFGPLIDSLASTLLNAVTTAIYGAIYGALSGLGGGILAWIAKAVAIFNWINNTVGTISGLTLNFDFMDQMRDAFMLKQPDNFLPTENDFLSGMTSGFPNYDDLLTEPANAAKITAAGTDRGNLVLGTLPSWQVTPNIPETSSMAAVVGMM